MESQREKEAELLHVEKTLDVKSRLTVVTAMWLAMNTNKLYAAVPAAGLTLFVANDHPREWPDYGDIGGGGKREKKKKRRLIISIPAMGVSWEKPFLVDILAKKNVNGKMVRRGFPKKKVLPSNVLLSQQVRTDCAMFSPLFSEI